MTVPLDRAEVSRRHKHIRRVFQKAMGGWGTSMSIVRYKYYRFLAKNSKNNRHRMIAKAEKMKEYGIN